MTLRAKFPMMRMTMPVIEKGGILQRDWFLFLTNLYAGVTNGLPQDGETITVTASPMTYQALLKGQLFVVGGTVSAIEFSRNGTDFYAVAGSPAWLDTGDYARITYTVAPTLTFFPF